VLRAGVGGEAVWRGAPWILGVVGAAQVGFVVLNIWAPTWHWVNLDKEHNLPTWFHSALLATVGLLALEVGRLEARLFGRTGRDRRWAIAWVGVSAGFAYLAADESLVIHEGFYTRELRAWLAPSSPLQLTLAWLLVFLPAIVGAVAFFLASLGARARLSPSLIGWAGGGLVLWVVALTLEGTTKSFFIPRDLYRLEVILEETAESAGTTLFAVGVWRYRSELWRWLGAAPGRELPRFSVPWRWVIAGTLGLSIPAGIVGVSVLLNLHVLHGYAGDEHFRSGRLDDASRAYRDAVAAAPEYVRGWTLLGVTELQRGDPEAAERAFAVAERLAPRASRTLNYRGVALFRLGRHEEARATFARATAADPADADAHRNLGLTLRHLGREAEARESLLKAQQLRPERLRLTSVRISLPTELPLLFASEAGVESALRESLAGRLASAVEAYRRRAAESPGLAAAHLGLANELFRIRVARRIVATDTTRIPSVQDAARHRPSALFTTWVSRSGVARDEVEVIVEADSLPQEVAASVEEIRRHYERAIELGAKAPAHWGLALLARETGDLADAEAHAREARRLDGTLPALPDRAEGQAAVLR